MSVKEAKNIFTKISTIMKMELDTTSDDLSFVISVDNKFNLTIIYDDSLDSILFYSIIENVKTLDEKHVNLALRDHMKSNLFGLAKNGGVLGLSEEDDIVYSFSIRNVTSFNADSITEEYMADIFDTVENIVKKSQERPK